MFGKLTLEQRKALQTLLIKSGAIDKYQGRVDFLTGRANLGRLIKVLPMEEQISIFAGALVREAERLGSPPDLGQYATVLLAKGLQGVEAIQGIGQDVTTLDEIIRVYVPSHTLSVVTPTTSTTMLTGSDIPKPPVKILFLSPNPMKLTQLDVQKEMREIRDELRDGDREGRFTFDIGVAVRTRELTRLLIDHKPTILHFAGHGVEDEGLWFRNDDDEPLLVNPHVLALAFSHPTIKKQLNCVVLNACWSDSQATALVQNAGIPYVVGMTNAISDKGAIAFAAGFYRGLSDGMTVEDAFYFGRNEMVLRLNEMEYQNLARLQSVTGD